MAPGILVLEVLNRAAETRIIGAVVVQLPPTAVPDGIVAHKCMTLQSRAYQSFVAHQIVQHLNTFI